MNERELDDVLGDDLPDEELARLRRVDELLRSVPAPPAEVPSSLNRAVERIGRPRSFWSTRRLAAGAAVAAAVAALAFGVGRWSESRGPEYRAAVEMAVEEAPADASAVLKLGSRDESTGNWEIELDVSGLPHLPPGDYYVLWLARDGKYAAECGTFNVGPGLTRIEMTASYRLADYDAWVISVHGEDTPRLFSARIA